MKKRDVAEKFVTSRLFLFLHIVNDEVEISIWIRLILQEKMPPLGINWLKAMLYHGLTENHAVLELLLGNLAIFRN